MYHWLNYHRYYEFILVDKKLHHRLPVWAIPSIRNDPIAERADGNVCVVSPHDNVGQSESPIRINCQDKNTMKSITQTIVRVVIIDKRKWTEALRPKGKKSDYNGWIDVIGNGHTVSGLQMASKVFTIICDVELGKPYNLPGCLGRSLVRGNDGLEGIGSGKKRMSIYNRPNRGSKFVLTRNGADLPSGVSLYARRQTCECE